MFATACASHFLNAGACRAVGWSELRQQAVLRLDGRRTGEDELARRLPRKKTRGSPGSCHRQICHYGSGNRFPTTDPTIVTRSTPITQVDKRIMTVLVGRSQPAQAIHRLCIVL
jgi:hypothetical protein